MPFSIYREETAAQKGRPVEAFDVQRHSSQLVQLAISIIWRSSSCDYHNYVRHLRSFKEKKVWGYNHLELANSVTKASLRGEGVKAIYICKRPACLCGLRLLICLMQLHCRPGRTVFSFSSKDPLTQVPNTGCHVTDFKELGDFATNRISYTLCLWLSKGKMLA